MDSSKKPETSTPMAVTLVLATLSMLAMVVYGLYVIVEREFFYTPRFNDIERHADDADFDEQIERIVTAIRGTATTDEVHEMARTVLEASATGETKVDNGRPLSEEYLYPSGIISLEVRYYTNGVPRWLDIYDSNGTQRWDVSYNQDGSVSFIDVYDSNGTGQPYPPQD